MVLWEVVQMVVNCLKNLPRRIRRVPRYASKINIGSGANKQLRPRKNLRLGNWNKTSLLNRHYFPSYSSEYYKETNIYGD